MRIFWNIGISRAGKMWGGRGPNKRGPISFRKSFQHGQRINATNNNPLIIKIIIFEKVDPYDTLRTWNNTIWAEMVWSYQCVLLVIKLFEWFESLYIRYVILTRKYPSKWVPIQASNPSTRQWQKFPGTLHMLQCYWWQKSPPPSM